MAKGFVNSKTGQEVVLLHPNEKGRKHCLQQLHIKYEAISFNTSNDY